MLFPTGPQKLLCTEFWNTVSNISLVALALFGLVMSVRHNFERRFHVQYASVIAIGKIQTCPSLLVRGRCSCRCVIRWRAGVGSTMFHATLRNLYACVVA